MRRRVVYLDHTGKLSGGELALLRLLPHVEGQAHVILAQHGPLEARLRDLGVSVEVLPLDAGIATLPRDRVTFRRLPLGVYWQVSVYTLRLRRRLRSLRPDLVHTNSLKSALYGGVAGRLAGIPVVWHLRDRIADDYLPPATVQLVRLLSRFLPSTIIANSWSTLDTLPRRRLSHRRDAVISSPVALSDVQPRRPGSQSGGAVVVGMVGRLAPWKGQDVFVRAFAQAFSAGAVRGRIVGDALFGEDEYAASLRDLVQTLGLSEQMTFVGFREDIFSEYAGMDILVHASVVPEPFGQVVLEGMAAGVAVIAAAAGGPLETISHEVDGLLVEPGNVAALAAAMRLLVDDEALRHRLQSAGPQKAAQYGSETIGAQVTAVHSATLEPRTVPEAVPELMRRRVVYLDHTGKLSGGELALLRLLPHVEGQAHVILAQHGPLEARLRDLGVSVEVLPLDAGTATLPRDRVTFRRLPLGVYWQVSVYTLRLRRRLRSLRPDLVHTNSLKSALYGGVGARLAGIPVVWHLHDRIADDYLPPATVQLVRLLSRFLPSTIIANSRSTLDTLPRRRLSHRRDAVISSPVALSDVQPRRPGSQSGGAVVVGMVGRLAPWKGQDVFVRAFAQAFSAGAVRGRIVGDALFGEDEYAASLRDLVQTLGLSEQMTFVGFREDIFSEYAGMDILVHASVVPEPFGQVVLEGMAAGVAVIAAAAGGPLETISHEVDGLLVEPGNVAALAAAMRLLVDDEALRHRLQSAGPQKAAQYGSETIGAQVTAVHSATLEP